MFCGLNTFCLKSSDLEKSRAFYTALGLTVIQERSGQVLLMSNGDFEVACMTFLTGNSLNLRGQDPFAICETLKEAGQTVADEPSSYRKEENSADADGTSWFTHDPDGNGLFFDTNELETGENGEAMALWRVLNGAHRQLHVLGASEGCLEAFETSVLRPFRKEPQHPNLPQANLPTQVDPVLGALTYCLAVKDAEASRRYYEVLGFECEAGKGGAEYFIATNGDLTLALMPFLPGNCLNFRGGDPFAIHERVKETGLPLKGEPTRYEGEEFNMDEGGAHWQTEDPDGNVVYFDTVQSERIERGDQTVIAKALQRTAALLEKVGAPKDCQSALVANVLVKYGSTE